MPDGRMLSKSIAWSEQVGAVSLEADYLFMRIIPHLDSAGRLIGSPKAVKAMCCPLRDEMTPDTVERALRALAEAGLILWYSVRGHQYIECPGFVTHQRGARLDREAPTRVPPPSDADTAPLRIRSGAGPELVRVSEVKLSEVKSSEIHVASGDATSVCGATADDEPRRPPRPARSEYSHEFEQLWAEYPPDGRGTKKTAGKAYQARLRDGYSPAVMLAGLTRYKAFLAATGRYAKNASTFVGPDLHFLEPWEIPRGASGPTGENPQQRAERVEAERKLRLERVTARRQSRDGDEWWQQINREATERGLTKAGEIYDYAYKQLAS